MSRLQRFISSLLDRVADQLDVGGEWARLTSDEDDQ